MTLPILPGATLGVLGGGQLGRMFILRARELGYRTAVFDPDEHSPAAAAADLRVCAAYDDVEAVTEFATICDAVTIEFENVPASVLEVLALHVPVAPSAANVSLAQDRLMEKGFIRSLGLATAAYAPVWSEADAESAVATTGSPALLKTTRFGYDGKGQARIFSVDDVRAAFREFGGVPCILEQRLALDYELSVIVVRGRDGAIAMYEPSENVHHNGILHTSLVPSLSMPNELRPRIEAIVTQLVAAQDYVGVMGVELFVAGGEIYVNEIAPRPHNSGHWTQEGAETCQFEQQVRALAGLPLGPSGLTYPTCMINILGDVWPSEGQPHWLAALQVDGTYLHLYGKAVPRRGRKMGHMNVIGSDPEDTLVRAEQAWKALHRPLGPPPD